jgi:hypothetical protein
VKFLHEGFLFINNRMDITSNQFLAALDSYMKENGGGAKYFATRMKRIFDNKDAPLNPKGALAKVISTLSTSATTISDTSKELKKSVTPFIKKLDTFGEILPGLSKSLKSFEKNIQALDIKKDKTVASTSKVVSKNRVSNLEKISQFFKKSPLSVEFINANIPISFTKTNLKSLNNFLLEKPLPITIQGISPDVLNVLRVERDKEPVLPPLTTDKNKSGMVGSVINNYNTNYIPGSKDKEGSSSLLGKIFKWGALILGGILLAPYIDKFLNKSELGQKIKTFTTNIFSKLGEWVDSFFNGGHFESSALTLLSLMKQGFSFIFNSVSDTIERNKDSIWEGLGNIGLFILNEIIVPSFKWIGNKILAGEFMGLAGAYLVARMLPITGPIVKLLEKPLLKGVKLIGLKLFNVFKSAPLTNTITTASSTLGRLGTFLGRLGVIGGIIGIGGLAIERLWTLGQNIKKAMDEKDGVFGLDDMRDTEETNTASLLRNKVKSETRVQDWEKLKGERELTPIEKLMEAKDQRILKIKELNAKLGLISKNEDLSYTTVAVSGGMGGMKPVKIPTDRRPQKERLAAVMEEIAKERQEITSLNSDIQKLSNSPSVEVEKKEIRSITPTSPKMDTPLMLQGTQPDGTFKHQKIMEEKLDTLTEIMAANIQAILQSGGQVANTVAATAGANASSTSKNYGSGDSIREQKIRSAQAIETPGR